MADRLLEVRGLRVRFATEDGVVRAVDGLDFDLDRGNVLGIVGESGSGKSVTALRLLGLTRTPNAAFEGQVIDKGQDLLGLSEARLRHVRGNEIEDVTKRMAKRRSVELLRQVGISNPEQRVDDYPHQFSDGMRQRAMIAMALSCNPARRGLQAGRRGRARAAEKACTQAV
jgi:peptide/nickel transport system ATP-binding protein